MRQAMLSDGLYTTEGVLSMPNNVIVTDFIFADRKRAVGFGRVIFGDFMTDDEIIRKSEEFSCRNPLEYAYRAVRWMRTSRLMMNSFHKYEERRMLYE